MPQELLPFPPLYCVVGAYRLLTDRHLWVPIWTQSSSTLFSTLYFLPLILISYPLTQLYVTLVLSRSPFSPSNIHDAAYFGISPKTFMTVSLVMGQISWGLEWRLGRVMRKARKEVYEKTVQSRGKGPEFWKPYVEEWSIPPFERASRNAQKQPFYQRLASPLVRLVLLRVLLTPLSFVPFLSLGVLALIRCLTLARELHKPFFEAKKMTPLQIELFMVERQTEYRLFGFVATLMERIPIVGIVFGVSNRIGAAMWAFDLEKRQHAFAAGEIPRTKMYKSKTAELPPDDLPEGAVGGFPRKKAPVVIGALEGEGTGMGTGMGASGGELRKR